MKSILLACSLLTGVTLASAQQAEVAQAQPRSAADTLITLTEDELAKAVLRVAQARLAAEASAKELQPQTQLLQSGLSAEDLRLIKLQMLLQALGLTPGLAPVPQAQPQSYAIPQPYSAQPAIATSADPRIDRLEQLMLLLLQQRQAEQQALTLSGRSSRAALPPQQLAAQQTSDSLLWQLQQELTSLRASQPQPVAQPQVIIQQVPQLQPQALAPEMRTELRTDTVVRSTHFKRQVFFATGKSELLPEARLTLNEVYRILNEDPAMQLLLTGYASPEGSAKRNAELSARRSQAVLDYLLACGITADRLQVVAGGVDHQADLRGVARRVDLELRK